MDSSPIRHIIVFPDIHGRDFWRQAVARYKDDSRYVFVFLGDYVDPYLDIDGIDEDEAVYNLNELRSALYGHPRTKWLLGNHDWHYMPWMRNVDTCRRSRKYFQALSDIFYRDLDDFDIAWQHTADNGRRFLFTHAGVDLMWAKVLALEINGNDDAFAFFDADMLNRLKDGHRDMLWCISTARGGLSPYASCLWTGLHDLSFSDIECKHLAEDDKRYASLPYQVFGHTYASAPIINNRWAMLDCKMPFDIDCATGTITPFGISTDPNT